MWEYRVLWRDARRSYSFGNAWAIIRCMTSTYMLIEESKKTASDESVEKAKDEQ